MKAVLALLVGELSIMVFIRGKIASMDLSMSLEIVLATLASPPASPLDNLIAYFDARVGIGATPEDWKTGGITK